MANRSKDAFEVECPCCKSKLTIDGSLEVVLSHIPPVRPPSIDLDDTARLLRIRGAAMQQAVPVGEGAMAVQLVHTLVAAT